MSAQRTTSDGRPPPDGRATAGGAALTLHSATGRWVMIVAVLGSSMAFLDGTIVNVALPTIGRDLGASTSQLQWILSGYLLTLASLILLGGSLGDRLGRRRVFVIGTIVFSGSSLLCALAPNVETLIAARLVQGVGGALLTPGSLAMIEASFRREDRPRAIGAWSGLTGVAGALGPLLGGYLISAASWRAAFLINLPLGAFVVLFAHHVPESRDPTAHGRIDFPGATFAALALAGSTYALIEGPRTGMSAAIALTGGGAVLAFVAFLVVERRGANPMIPLGIFSRQFSAANVVTFVVYAAFGGVFFLLVAFLQISMGYSPIAAGAATLPQTVLMLLLSARAGALAQRIGPRLPLTVGPLLVAAGMLLMTQINPGDAYLTSVLPAVLVFGAGVTLVAAPVTATVLAAVDDSHSGIASGVNNAVARVAGLLAVAVLPLVAGLTGHSFYVPADMTRGFHMAMVVSAALAALGGVIAWATIDNSLLEGEKQVPGEAAPAPEYSCAVTGPPLRDSLSDAKRSEPAGYDLAR
jgi:EmrB/QacA subfamily drug resistance transporter